eukprot:TRINITY_DN3824_c0_g1_i2.p1 TRINITY_DN3824_c0_g1~~TRINITY_DN3824_c0_g1_i2.p1  ORF type:complete len:404 (-),score=108.94 TRINITY_DN3824_c0_g1_i2:39-1250(-)
MNPGMREKVQVQSMDGLFDDYKVLEDSKFSDEELHLRSDARFFRKVAKIYEVARKFNIKIDMPVDVLIGEQKSGKTSLVEIMTSLVCGHRDESSTGTRFPILWTLLREENPNARTRVFVQDQELPTPRLLRSRLKELSADLSARNEFSEDPVSVKVCSPHVVNYMIIDLPGLRAENSPQNKMIKKLIAKYARDPKNSLVIVNKAEEKVLNFSLKDLKAIIEGSDEDLAEFSAGLPAPSFDWEKRSVVVMNKAEKFLPDASNLSAFKEAVPRIQGHGCPTYLTCLFPEVALNPTGGAPLPETLPPEAAERRLKNVQKEEEKYFSGFRDVIEKQVADAGEALSSEMKQVLANTGSFNMINFLNQRMMGKLIDAIPAIEKSMETNNPSFLSSSSYETNNLFTVCQN